MRKSPLQFLLVLALLPAIPLSAEDAKPALSAERAERTVTPATGVATTNSMEANDSKRRLVIGDRLSYRVVQERGEPQGLVLTDSGDVEVPLIGRVPATGKTCRQLAYEIKGLLEKEYFHHATVIVGLNAVSAKSRGLIYILGPVRSQGPMEIPLEGTFTLSKAIMRAGGFADFANGAKVKLVRKNKSGEPKTIPYNVADILKGRPGEDPELEPDDMVIVPEKFINF